MASVMASLNSFKSDLALEQDINSNTAGRRGIDADAQFIRTDTDELKEAHEKQQLGLGHAFLVLFQANRSAIKRAIYDTSAESTLSSSVRCLITHVRPDENGQDETSLSRMQEVYRPLLDKTLKKSDVSGRKIAFLLLDWLILDYPYKELMAQALSVDLEFAGDKKRKLAVLLAIEHAIHTGIARILKSKGVGGQSYKGEYGPEAQLTASKMYPEARILSQWISLLSEIVHSDSAVGSDGSRNMTRLTSLAMDVAIDLSGILADQSVREIQIAKATREPRLVMELSSNEGERAAIQETYGWCFSRSMLNIDRILQEYKASEQNGNMMAFVSTLDILDLVSRFNKHQISGTKQVLCHDILGSFAQSWTIISSALRQRKSVSSLTSAFEQAQEYLGMKIPPFLKLLAACIMLGQCDPSTPMDEIFQTSKNIKSTLITLSNAMIAEDIPVGRNAAHAVQDLFLRHPSVQDLEQLRYQVSSILDNASEVTMGSAELGARYIMASPASLVQELIKRLPQSDLRSTGISSQDSAVTRARNVISVVEVLAEKDFFNIVISKEDADGRSMLENAMIGQLQNSDINIKNMTKRFVASIDMDKIIQRFCLELKSTGNKSRLDTEAILVECMLSQRKDGSLGDGFVSFIDYIRLRLRSSFRRTAVVLKSPAQLLLNVKDISNDLIDQGPNTNANMTERLFHVVKLLGESVPATLWKSIIDCLVLKTYGCPSDQHLIRVWNNLASAIANSSEAVIAVSTSILDIMKYQGTITEQILEEALEASDEAVVDLRLARLSPLLMLKTIPARGLARQYRNMELAQETKSIADQMKEVLKSRSDNHLEFSLVRTLSKAVLNGMFPDSSLEIIFAGLSESCSQKSTHIRQIDLVESRSWLFALYDWILNWTIQSNTREQTVQDVAWVYRIAVEFCYNIVSFKLPDKDLEQDLYKLQLGVVDVLSKILLATAPFYSGSPTSQFAIKLKRLGRSSTRLHTGATIEEIEDDHVVETSEDGDMTPEDLFLSVLYDVLEAITVPVYDCDESRIGAALCLVNVFIMSLQGMAPSRISEGSANESRDSSDTKKLIPSTFMDLLAPTVSACVISYLHNMETLDTNSYTLLIQGFIQILYTGTSITGTGDGQALSKTTRKWIMDVIVAGIICTDTTIAVASLKLLATAAGSKMITPELLTEANLVTIRKGLEQLRQRNELKLDTSTSVSTLLDNMWQMVA